MAPKESVLITGCSDGGIGSALALEFQKRGDFHVFATARDISKMSKLDGLSGITRLKLDVVKSDDIKAAVAAIEQTGGILNYLINNAGRNHFMPVLDENLEAVRNLFEINFLGPLALTQAFAPLLIKAKGMAIFVTSISGYLSIPYMGTYSASKKSLEIVADTLRLELAPFGVDVLEVVTGAVKTNGQTYFGDLKLPNQSIYKPVEEIFVKRAQGQGDGLERMDSAEYACAVVDAITKRTSGRFWYGINADAVKMSTTAVSVPQSAMDAGAVMGTGLDMLGSKSE